MLRKVLIFFVAGAVFVAWGADEAVVEKEGSSAGRYLEFRDDASRKLTDEQREQIQQLEAIGYFGGKVERPFTSGVVIHDKARCFEGYNFYTSGHAQEALLVDMDGKVVHRWAKDPGEVWDADIPNTRYWRRGHLFENGDILVIYEGYGIAKLTKDSEVIWKSQCKAHHDVDVTADGHIYLLTRKAHLAPDIHPDKPILEDFLAVLDADGKMIKEMSLLGAFQQSDYHSIWDASRVRSGDLFHTNSVRVLDGVAGAPAFAKGNVLLSMPVLNAVAVVDLIAEKVVWANQDIYRLQHDARIVEKNHLLIFDNHGPEGDFSRVLEYELPGMKVVWDYTGTPERPFFSAACGTAMRLPNGNTLIAESDNGRAIEVTREKEVVWEFISPHRAGENGKLIATLFEMVRLPSDFPLGWAQGAPPASP